MNLLNSKNNCFEQYTHSYEEVGAKILDHPINNQMYQMIADSLPHNYRAVDLGCNNNRQAKLIQQICRKQGKQGVFVGVDPFYRMEGVIPMTSQEFMKISQKQEFDVIMGKYSIHLNKNMPEFFLNVYRCLKNNGQMFILALNKNTKLPWTKPLQNTFTHPYVDYQQTIPRELFQWESIKEDYEFEINKQIFMQIIKRRSWSTLLRNSQQEINQCLAILQREKRETLPLQIRPELYILRKKLSQ